MPAAIKTKEVYRIIDANFNRLKEGLRVCEEISRFILQDSRLSTEIKHTRHKIGQIIKHFITYANLIKGRDSLMDIGKNIHAIGELKRKGIKDIFFANIQRVKESIRVLEEFSKLYSEKSALEFKALRYSIYEIEKKAAKRLAALRYYR